jgi:hypothetical protein
VYSATINADDVLAYVHESGRQEEEFILMPATMLPRRIK